MRATILVAFLILSSGHCAEGGVASLGDRHVRVTVKTGSYAAEQRWTLYEIDPVTGKAKNPSGWEHLVTDECPGQLDGLSTSSNVWNRRLDERTKYLCMHFKDTDAFSSKDDYANGLFSFLETANGQIQRCKCPQPAGTLATMANPGDCSVTTDVNKGNVNANVCVKIGAHIKSNVTWYGLPGGQATWSTSYIPGFYKGTDKGYQDNNKLYFELLELIPGATYRFKAFDTYGDGWNNGHFKVTSWDPHKDRFQPVTTYISEEEGTCTQGYICDSKTFTMPAAGKCPAGFYCPTTSDKIECGNYTVYCPEGSFSPVPVNPGMCGSSPAEPGNYKTCTTSKPCSALLVEVLDNSGNAYSKSIAQPTAHVVKIKLTNNGLNNTISWGCRHQATNDGAQIQQLTTGVAAPAWKIDANSGLPSCFNEEISQGWTSSGKEWVHWSETHGILHAGDSIELEAKLMSAMVPIGGYRALMKFSYVTPSESLIKPPLQESTYQFTMNVTAAQSILVFPFEINAQLKVGEKLESTVYVFNIGSQPKFGVFLNFDTRLPWLSMDASKYCNETEFICNTGPPCKATNMAPLASNLAKSNISDFAQKVEECVASNDRTFKQYTMTFFADDAARSTPYESTLTLKTTELEEVDIRLRMKILPGDTDEEKSQVIFNRDKGAAEQYLKLHTSRSNAATMTVKDSLDITLVAKDQQGGNTVNQDIFYMDVEPLSHISSLTFNLTNYSAEKSGEQKSVLQFVQNPAAGKGFLYTLKDGFTISAYGMYKLTVTLAGTNVGGPYYIFASEPHCNKTRGEAVDTFKTECLCSKGYGGFGDNQVAGPGLCHHCAPGKFKDEISLKPCSNCAAGKFNLIRQATDCDDCPSGRVAIEGQTNCTACKVGTYANSRLATCKKCPVGKHVAAEGRGSCNDCKNGKFADTEGLQSCKACSEGSAANVPEGGTSCIVCPAGTRADGVCTDCETGKFQPQRGKTVCRGCTDNKYSDAPKAESCKNCPAGLIIKEGTMGKSLTDCGCPSQSFYYPKVTARISFKTALDHPFSDDQRRKEFRWVIGSFLKGNVREYALRTGIKLEPHEAVSITFTETKGEVVTVVVEVIPLSAKAADTDKVTALFSQTAGFKDMFKKSNFDVQGSTQTLSAPFEDPSIISFDKKEDCEACPFGGSCPLGTVGEENILSLPGFWRPYPEIARFYTCNIPAEKDGKFWLWANCMGGKPPGSPTPMCAPVLDYAENPDIKDYFDNATFKYTADTGVFDFKTDIDNCNQTQSCNTYSMAMLDFFQHVQHDPEFMKVATGTNFTSPYDAFTKMNAAKYPIMDKEKVRLIGFYSGPLCSTCPRGSGRDGDAKSSLYCAPCPKEGNNLLTLFLMAFAIFMSCALLVLSQISKGSHEREMSLEHQDNLEQEKRLDEIDDEVHEAEIDARDDFDSIGKEKDVHGTKSGTRMAHKEIITGMFRIMLSYFQVTALARSVPIDWPNEVVSVLSAFEVVSSPSLNHKSVDCAFQSTGGSNDKAYYKKFEMMMFMPVFVILVPGVIWILYWWIGHLLFCCGVKRCCASQTVKTLKYAQLSGVGGNTVANMPLDEDGAYRFTLWQHRNRAMRRWLISILVVAFMVYATISKEILKMFACQRFGNKRYLIADYSIDCDDQEHDTYRSYAAFCFVLYSVGLPLIAFMALRPLIDGIHLIKNKPISATNPKPKGKRLCGKAPVTYTEKNRSFLMNQKMTAHTLFGFLWQGLEESGMAPYWEVIVVTPRKLIMVIIIINMQDVDANYQMVTAVIVLMFFLVFHVKVEPYDASIHNNLELGSLMVSQLTLFLGLIINFMTKNEQGSERTMTEAEFLALNGWLSAVIIMVNMAFMMYFFLAFSYHAYFVLPRPLQKLIKCLCCLCHKHGHKVAKHIVPTMGHNQVDEEEVLRRYNARRISNEDRKEMLPISHGLPNTPRPAPESHSEMRVTLPHNITPGSIIKVKSPWDSSIMVNVKVPYNARPGMTMIVKLPPMSHATTSSNPPPAPQSPRKPPRPAGDDEHVII